MPLKWAVISEEVLLYDPGNRRAAKDLSRSRVLEDVIEAAPLVWR
jgi:hypothetical protein